MIDRKRIFITIKNDSLPDYIEFHMPTMVVLHRAGKREIKRMLKGVQSEEIEMFQINYKNYTPSNKNIENY